MHLPLLALLSATMASTLFSSGAFPALLPEIGRAGHLPDWQLGVLAGAFGFARMLADVPVGLFITHHLRRALVLGPLLSAAGVLLLATGGPLAVLALARALIGVAHALGIIGSLTALLRYESGIRLAAALSVFELSAMLGMLGGTVMIDLVPATLGWNLALLVASAPQLLSLLLIPAVQAALPEEAPAPARPLFARGVPGAGTRPPVTAGVVLAFAAGIVTAVSYSTMEQFVIPLRGSRDFGLDRSGVARLLITVQVFDIACLLPAGILADRLGAHRVLGTMMVVFGTGVALVVFGGFALLVAGCALFGIGMAAWTLPLALLRRDTPAAHIGWRTAVYRVGVDCGMFLGPFLSGLLAGTAPRLLPALMVAALGVVGLALWARGRRSGR